MTQDPGGPPGRAAFARTGVGSRAITSITGWKTHPAQTKSHSSMGYSPTQARLLFATVVVAVSWPPAPWAQPAASANLQAPASAQAGLTVTATVVSSVGMMIGPDGQPIVILANAPSPRDILSASVHSSQQGLAARNELAIKVSGVCRTKLKGPACAKTEDRRSKTKARR
jgi:hypothetical protein